VLPLLEGCILCKCTRQRHIKLSFLEKVDKILTKRSQSQEFAPFWIWSPKLFRRRSQRLNLSSIRMPKTLNAKRSTPSIKSPTDSQAKNALKYFAGLGHKCPPNYNPADFMLDLVSIDYRKSLVYGLQFRVFWFRVYGVWFVVYGLGSCRLHARSHLGLCP